VNSEAPFAVGDVWLFIWCPAEKDDTPFEPASVATDVPANRTDAAKMANVFIVVLHDLCAPHGSR
jgi:hypothetical protein